MYYIYLMSSRSSTLYVGVTNDLRRRVEEHKRTATGFTGRYGVTRLVYADEFVLPIDAIAAEKRIKGWTRAKKLALILEQNPFMRDLTEDW